MTDLAVNGRVLLKYRNAVYEYAAYVNLGHDRIESGVLLDTLMKNRILYNEENV